MKRISFQGELKGEVDIPGSKYIANRVIPIAAMADGVSVIKNVPQNDDIDKAIEVFKSLGVQITRKKADTLIIPGKSGKFEGSDQILSTGESGTLMRFATAISTLVEGDIKITGSERIKERPVGDLVSSLQDIGADIDRENGGYPPVVVKSHQLQGGRAWISGEESSQYISAILLISPFAQRNVEINVTEEPVSKTYIDLTIELMEKFGVEVSRLGYKKFFIDAGQVYQGQKYVIPSDWSSANYFFAAAAITKGKISIDKLDLENPQGEAKFIEILEQMGCQTKIEGDQVTLSRNEDLKGIEIDMSSRPDSVPALSAVASFSEEQVIIKNIEHLKYKESNRIKAIVKEFGRAGAEVSSEDGNLYLKTGDMKSDIFDPHGDHRMAMSLALLGLKIPDINIKDPECVNKSFPGFWQTLASLGVDVQDV